VRERRGGCKAVADVTRLARGAAGDRYYGAEMAGPEPPKVQIGHAVALRLDSAADLPSDLLVGVHVEQAGGSVADEAVAPAGDNAGANDAGERVHLEPAEDAGQGQTNNDEYRDGGIGHHVDNGGAQVVIMLCRSVGVIMIVILVVGGAGEQPSGGDVHGEAQAGDGGGLSEADRHR
jgi:hypothetical protein